MSVKLIAAAIVLLVGAALASLFPRTEDPRVGEALRARVSLRREAPPLDHEARSFVQASQPIPGLPSLKAAVAPTTNAAGTQEFTSAATSSYRSELRNPPPMPTEYQALTEVRRPEPLTTTQLKAPSANATGTVDQPPRKIVHRIVDGDTLASLAERYLGDASLADHIWHANRNRLPLSPNLLPIGVELEIPPRTLGATRKRELADIRQPDGALTFLVPVEPPPVVADVQSR